jgi:hypothetical protein
MRRVPSLASIREVERRVAQHGRDAVNHLRGARIAARAALGRPSTLAWIAGASCMLGFWLSHRPRTPAAPQGAGATSTSAMALLAGFAVRWAMRSLPAIVRQLGR